MLNIAIRLIRVSSKLLYSHRRHLPASHGSGPAKPSRIAGWLGSWRDPPLFPTVRTHVEETYRLVASDQVEGTAVYLNAAGRSLHRAGGGA